MLGSNVPGMHAQKFRFVHRSVCSVLRGRRDAETEVFKARVIATFDPSILHSPVLL